MAVRRSLSRNRRSVSAGTLPPPAAVPDPLGAPCDEHPRWRLRVFDRKWPWRVTRGEAFRDAIASRNARRDVEDRLIYLDACAAIQRDPPYAADRWRILNGEIVLVRREGER